MQFGLEFVWVPDWGIPSNREVALNHATKPSRAQPFFLQRFQYALHHLWLYSLISSKMASKPIANGTAEAPIEVSSLLGINFGKFSPPLCVYQGMYLITPRGDHISLRLIYGLNFRTGLRNLSLLMTVSTRSLGLCHFSARDGEWVNSSSLTA